MELASKPRTIDFYQEKLDRLLSNPAIADARLDMIDEEAIEAYKRMRSTTARRRGTAVSPAAINRELATLRRLLRTAHQWKRIRSVPRIKLLRGDTGLRVGEALSLAWPQVNLRSEPGFLTIRAVPAKTGKSRTIPLRARARGVIESLEGRHGLVFRNGAGDPLYHTWLDQQHAIVRKITGIPGGLRASFAAAHVQHPAGETRVESFTIMKPWATQR